MATVSWEPSLEQVADIIPTRTRDPSTPGSDVMLGTFTAATTPSGEQASRKIRAAVSEVLSAVVGVIPAVPTYLAEFASEAAALRAAADIELAYPQRDADVSVYEQLNQRANDALTRLIGAVDDVGSGPEGSLLPAYAFPEPGWPGDYPI